MSSVRTLVRSMATYASANIVNSAIPFLLLPVLTRVLSPAEYGAVAMFTTLMTVLSAFTGLSLHGAVSVRYFSKDTDHPRFVGTCLAVLGVSTFVVLLIVWLFSAPLSNSINLPLPWLLAAVLGSAIQAIINIRLVVWQVKGEAVRYSFFQVSQTLLNLSLSLCLILAFGMGWEGRGVGMVVAISIFGALAIFSLQFSGRIIWNPDRDYIKAALRFGIPLIPHSLGAMMMSMSDRFIIMYLLGATATGNYAVGAQVGMLVGILADAFGKAFAPHLYGGLKDADDSARLKIARQCLVAFLFFLLLAVIYVMVLPYVYQLLVSEAYGASLEVAQIIGFGNAFMGMYYVVSGFIFFSEKTGILSRLTISIGLLNIGLTFFLVDYMGVLGAAWSYTATQFLFFLGAWYIANRVYPMPWFSLCFINKA